MAVNRNLPFAAAALAMAFGATMSASAAEAVRVRGTIVRFEGSTLTVKARDGATEAIALKPDWKVSGVARVSLDDIKVGDFLGIASAASAGGGEGALEVVLFPAAMKGTGEGSRGWDLKPNSTMTNATVESAVQSVDGRSVTVAYHGQTKTISIATNTPIVTFAPATPADLVAGATVFVPAEKGDSGQLAASRVIVGTNGVTPPM